MFAAKMVPAKFVGGDFYDFIELEQDRLGMLVGDVSGKGVSAALYMAKLMSDFRYVATQSPQPGSKFQKQIILPRGVHERECLPRLFSCCWILIVKNLKSVMRVTIPC
jgi:hypothetical protein